MLKTIQQIRGRFAVYLSEASWPKVMDDLPRISTVMVEATSHCKGAKEGGRKGEKDKAPSQHE